MSVDTNEPAPRRIITNRLSVRSYAHGMLRRSWWSAERSLEQIEMILNELEVQLEADGAGDALVDRR
jgi:hypothetical protein